MNRGKLRTNLRALLGDKIIGDDIDAEDIDNGSTWSSAELNSALEVAIYEYVIRTNATRVKVSASLSATGEFSIPDDCVKILNVLYSSNSLMRSTPAYEYDRNPAWETKTDTATRRYVVIQGNKIKLTPYLSSWSSGSPTATLDYIQQPAAISDDLTEPDARVLERDHKWLPYAAAAWLLREGATDEEDVAKSVALMEMFTKNIGG